MDQLIRPYEDEMIFVTDGHPLDRIRVAQEIDRLLRLAADLGAIREGTGPSDADLSDAPILDNWARTIRPTLCLNGDVSGHPLLRGTSRNIISSDLWVLAEQQGWARTLSRWYRLGRQRNLLDCRPDEQGA
ncbi:DUF6634 family protein [Microvirga brassicacearum]|uniref:Uncharacterized protein n=1 Tax=Microvirga brassicacearum TaxID=2580413 RepID=A0A5N3P390_9HYPH|nr:DUF6634 family protein [Microvirga brassicacearum]KAB0264196.1 hypothetical protein FEZ63_24470 [Microvirga brassicacearum]